MGAGIPHDTYRTSDITKYCSVTFSAEYVIGVGKEEGEHFIAFANDDVCFDMDKRGEGFRAKAENVWATLYARPDERLAFPSTMQRTLKLPKGAANAKRQFPAFAFVFAKRSDCEKKRAGSVRQRRTARAGKLRRQHRRARVYRKREQRAAFCVQRQVGVGGFHPRGCRSIERKSAKSG